MFDPLELDRQVAELVALLQKMPVATPVVLPIENESPRSSRRKPPYGTWSRRPRKGGASGELPFDLGDL